MTVPCVAANPPAIASTASSFRFPSMPPKAFKYPPADTVPGATECERSSTKMGTATTTAGAMPNWSNTRQETTTSSPPTISGPSTSPRLPPVPCREMANPRLPVKTLDKAPMAGGCQKLMPNIITAAKIMASRRL